MAVKHPISGRIRVKNSTRYLERVYRIQTEYKNAYEPQWNGLRGDLILTECPHDDIEIIITMKNLYYMFHIIIRK